MVVVNTVNTRLYKSKVSSSLKGVYRAPLSTLFCGSCDGWARISLYCISKVNEEITFKNATSTPLFVSVDIKFAKAFISFFFNKHFGKTLTSMEQATVEYSEEWLLARINIAIIRTTSMCVSGTRRK